MSTQAVRKGLAEAEEERKGERLVWVGGAEASSWKMWHSRSALKGEQGLTGKVAGGGVGNILREMTLPNCP